MQDMNLIVREPLLNAKQQVVGYELSWLQKNTTPKYRIAFERLDFH